MANGQAVTLGRSAAATYAFEDPLLSRRHCAVEARGELCRIVDLQSRNGTFVNGQRVGACLLNVGDRVKVGSLVLEVCPAGTPPSPPGPNFSGGRTPARDLDATLSAEHCEACGAPFSGGRGRRELRGRMLCGACFDRYDVDEDLIEGFKIKERREVTSYGVSYLAQQLLMDRPVILKVIETTGGGDDTSLRRFLREAKTAGRLSHPNIVELYDVNEQGDLFYIVTEYVDGETLQAILRRRRGRPIPLADALGVMHQIGSAVAYAHGQRIVHRDIKPANIIIRRHDKLAKLQGFTLAKSLERAGFSVITADGESLGTPYYMPPEQVKSAKTVDERSDIYSWGATTFHCVSGRLPLEARSYGEFIDKVFREDPLPLDRVCNASLPPELVRLVADTLRRKPADRPRSMDEVLARLEPVLRGLPQFQ